MKKILTAVALVAALSCGLFAANSAGKILLENQNNATYSPANAYYYVLNSEDWQLGQSQAFYKVSEFYENDFHDPDGIDYDYEGKIEFSFTPVKTDKGLSLRVTSKMINTDGLCLKDSFIKVVESAEGVNVVFTSGGTWINRTAKSKTFKVLIPLSKDEVIKEFLSEHVKATQKDNAVKEKIASQISAL
ncbi:hypothetical protein Emin_0671 [Elusimicrobium minutum Pei191]|uniref:Uncharacterized protein n=1 Tax=Elusimicrobium minutum (strain Pei191) TaxID=445932 RepID=B2KC99_ELUMP|nr:hypothetical protein [Elusimicrobium minutum]ACC98226.1 hypothetical protein Emin_0671 [Elusimicrobium minutum Pei191]